MVFEQLSLLKMCVTFGNWVKICMGQPYFAYFTYEYDNKPKRNKPDQEVGKCESNKEKRER